jgi:hypothetical protein
MPENTRIPHPPLNDSGPNRRPAISSSARPRPIRPLPRGLESRLRELASGRRLIADVRPNSAPLSQNQRRIKKAKIRLRLSGSGRPGQLNRRSISKVEFKCRIWELQPPCALGVVEPESRAQIGYRRHGALGRAAIGTNHTGGNTGDSRQQIT